MISVGDNLEQLKFQIKAAESFSLPEAKLVVS